MEIAQGKYSQEIALMVIIFEPWEKVYQSESNQEIETT